ncbi:hypothetical protein IGI37_002279 [Enterococcus sp. AZ194]|uniref:hypothetical protein n=1 Tax=Enterococcus sp. AZ194 TaxID=2774629 RepID=UPI003F294B68
MGLLDLLKQVKEDGFDPKNDKIVKDTRLAAGNYPVRLKSAQAGTSKMGQDQIAITLEVVSGKDKDRLETIYISFDDKLPEFVLEKNGRMLLKLSAMVGVEFGKKDLEDEYSASEALAKGVGTQFLMNLTISPNKKNPSYPYRNYDFEQLEDTDMDIEEDEFPF